MTVTIIACFIAGFFAAAFAVLWFTVTYRELSAKRRSIEGLFEQRALHERLYAKAQGGPDAAISASMLESSRMLCREGAKGYNALLRKPMNRIPALLLGFQAMHEIDP